MSLTPLPTGRHHLAALAQPLAALDAVVVHDGGQRRRLAVQGDGREWRPVLGIPTDDLGAEVLGLGRAATVASGQEPASVQQGSSQVAAPGVDAVDVGVQAVERPFEGGEVLTPGGQRRAQDPASAPSPAGHSSSP